MQKIALQMVRDNVQEMELTTENIANASMPGYKRHGVYQTGFSEELNQKVNGGRKHPKRQYVR